MNSKAKLLQKPKSVQFSAYPPISIVGLGYVGAVTAACLAEMTHQVIGVDLDGSKVAAIASGRAPLVETGLDNLTGDNVAAGRLRATGSLANAVANTEITFVCVGTPSTKDKTVDLTALRAVAAELGRALRRKGSYHLVVIRSTVPVGTTRTVVLPILEAESGMRCGQDFGLCFHPEFLREGVAIADFFSPPKTIVGGYDKQSADILAALYGAIDAPLIRTEMEVAEMVKYVDNTWHAVKVTYANEVGKLCAAVGVDSHEVMGIFVQDTKLNISPYYMRPGFAFGGSCLPKDVRALQRLGRDHELELPLIGSILESNDLHIERAVKLVAQTGGHRIAVLGVTFKPGTDDLRESPFIDLIGRLLRKGHAVRAFDPNVTAAGSKLALMHAKTASKATLAALGRLSELLDDSIEDIVRWSDVIVVCHFTAEIHAALASAGRRASIIDLVRLPAELREEADCVGICW